MPVSFIGVTVVQAVVTEKDSKPGYNVVGLPGSQGKTSWLDKAEFEHYHAPMAKLPFGLALESLRRGCCIYRASWPAGLYVQLATGDGRLRPLRYLSLSRLHRSIRPPRVWSPTSEEMLACDWTVGTNPPQK